MRSTREKIVKVGAQIIAHEGLRMFTAKKIGEKLGISDAAIFRHFPTMDSIAEEIISRYTNECLRRTDEAIEKGSNSVERLEMIIDSHIDLLEETRGVSPVLCFEFSRSNKKRLKSMINEFLDTYAKKVGKVLQEGIQEGDFRRDIEVEEISYSFIGLLQAKVFQWFIRGRKGKIVKDRAALKKMILEGILTRRP